MVEPLASRERRSRPLPQHRDADLPRASLRPRDPGQQRSGRFPFRTALAVALAGAVMVGGGMAAVRRYGGNVAPAAAPASSGTDQAPDTTLALPLDPASAGLTGGTSQEIDAKQGPAAVSFCRHAPTTAGIQAWRGTRMTDPTGQRRVVQVVSRFLTTQQASAYLTATTALVDCQSWQTGDKPTVRFSIAQSSSPNTFGEETRRFDLQALGDGSRFYLRSVLFRVGRQVVQLTYVSVDGTDLDNLDALAGRAAAQLTP